MKDGELDEDKESKEEQEVEEKLEDKEEELEKDWEDGSFWSRERRRWMWKMMRR